MLRKRFLASVACLLAIVPALPAYSKPPNLVKIYSETGYRLQDNWYIYLDSITLNQNYRYAWTYIESIEVDPISGVIDLEAGIYGVLFYVLVDCKRTAIDVRYMRSFFNGKLSGEVDEPVGLAPASGNGSSSIVRFVCSSR